MIVCKCCHRVTIAGLTRTEEAFVTKMSKAGKPITDQEMARGVNTSLTALRTRVAGLRRKLQQHGYTVTMNPGGAKNRARYALASIETGEVAK